MKKLTNPIIRRRLIAFGIWVILIPITCSPLCAMDEANDHYGWIREYLDPPRNSKQFDDLMGLYHKFDLYPWSTLDDVKTARIHVGTALMIYYFDRLSPSFREKLLADCYAEYLGANDLKSKTSSVAYKCANNGMVVHDKAWVEAGSYYWDQIGDHYGRVPPPPLKE